MHTKLYAYVAIYIGFQVINVYSTKKSYNSTNLISIFSSLGFQMKYLTNFKVFSPNKMLIIDHRDRGGTTSYLN